MEDPMAIQVPPDPQHPALRKHAEKRAEGLQNRVADAITTFAGSMMFVYIHLGWFAIWIIFKVERYPFGLLTMIVSLEAIFLSTFVMISQNRADAKRQVLADHQWEFVQAEEKQNEQLIALSNKILDLTTDRERQPEVHEAVAQHRHDRDLARRAERNGHSDQRRFDESESGRRDRDRGRHVRDRVCNQESAEVLMVTQS
jgi:uncharacterized membrane protein